MKTTHLASEPTANLLEISDYQTVFEFLRQMVEKHNINVKRAFLVRGHLLPIPEFLPEEILKKIPGEESVQKLVTTENMSVSRARGYVNVLRLIFSLEGIEIWKEQLHKEFKQH